MAINVLAFGDLNSLPEMAGAKNLAIEIFPMSDGSANTVDESDSSVRIVSVRNLSLSTLRIYGIDENCNARTISEPKGDIGPLQQKNFYVVCRSTSTSYPQRSVRLFLSNGLDCEVVVN